ncbi:MAG: P-loop NTPase [Christensenellales bacterium]
MSETCTHDCSSCGEACGDRREESLLFKPHEGSRIKRVIAVVSGKGGVGKSLITCLLAVLARRRQLSTAILDADITGPSIPRAFGLHGHAQGDDRGLYPIKTRSGISVMSLNLLTDRETDPVVWRGPMIAGAVKQFWSDVVWGEVDCLFIDMPPGTGDVPLTVFQSIPVDGVVIVASPQELVGMIVEKAINMARMMDIPVLALVENMSYIACPDCGKQIRPFGESRIEGIARRQGVETAVSLPIDPMLARACDTGTVELFEGSWLDDLLDKILSREEERS